MERLSAAQGTIALQKIKIIHIPLKRIFDILFSLTALLLGAPIFIAIAIAIKLTSKGAVFYAHPRIGRGFKIINCLKFRTMYMNADEKLEEILKSDPQKRKEWDETQKLKNDPRVTPLGTFLRKTSLDELPQFVNVLKGDLSVVGPRPLVALEVNKFLGNKAREILKIRPGLTCLWQVSGRNDLSYDHRIQLDERYIRNRSFWLDMRIIFKTIPAMLFSKGAY